MSTSKVGQRAVIYSMGGVSVDGFIAGPDGDIDWGVPDDELFRFHTEQMREVGVQLCGRRLYETMLYWETPEGELPGPLHVEWARVWRPVPKLVFSTTLEAVKGNEPAWLNDRIAALFGLAWIGVQLQEELTRPSWPGASVPAAHSIALVLVPLACYVAMLLMPRTRPRDARRLLWLAAVVLVGLAPSVGFANFGYGLGLQGMVLLALLVIGFFLVPAAPSLPLAFALALIADGLSLWTRAGGFGFTELHSVRWAMTTAGPLLLAGGAALRLVSARRSAAG